MPTDVAGIALDAVGVFSGIVPSSSLELFAYFGFAIMAGYFLIRRGLRALK